MGKGESPRGRVDPARRSRAVDRRKLPAHGRAGCRGWRQDEEVARGPLRRVAALADIHGNLPALEAVLSDLASESVDLVLVCGDVASGPLPTETLNVLRELPRARFVRGNADRSLVTAFDGDQLTSWPGPAADWCPSQLSREHRD